MKESILIILGIVSLVSLFLYLAMLGGHIEADARNNAGYRPTWHLIKY